MADSGNSLVLDGMLTCSSIINLKRLRGGERPGTLVKTIEL